VRLARCVGELRGRRQGQKPSRPMGWGWRMAMLISRKARRCCVRAQVRPGGLQRRGRGQPLEVDLSRCGCRVSVCGQPDCPGAPPSQLWGWWGGRNGWSGAGRPGVAQVGCFTRVRGGVHEGTPAVRVCMCVIGVSTCACVPQLYSDSLRTLQLGSAACIHAFQLPPTSCTRHSCLRARCLHVYASQPTVGAYRVVRAPIDMVTSSVRPHYRCAGWQRDFGPARRRIWPRWSSSDSGYSRYSAI
jgi:hypothetical protein